METNDVLGELLKPYLAENRAAQVVADGLRVLGIGFRPVIDHITFQAYEVDERAKEFLDLGYENEPKEGILHGTNWWAKIFRKQGYPALFICQPVKDERVKKSLIPDWITAFGEKNIYYAAVLVEDIENAVFYLEKQGVPFTGRIVGDKGADLRLVFAMPEVRDGKVHSVFGLVERHQGYMGFEASQVEELMASIQKPV